MNANYRKIIYDQQTTLVNKKLHNINIKVRENSAQEFGGNSRRSALAGGKRVIDDFNR